MKLDEAAWGLDIHDEWMKIEAENKGESARCYENGEPAFDLAGVHASAPDHPAITFIHGFSRAMRIHGQTFVEKNILGSRCGCNAPACPHMSCMSNYEMHVVMHVTHVMNTPHDMHAPA